MHDYIINKLYVENINFISLYKNNKNIHKNAFKMFALKNFFLFNHGIVTINKLFTSHYFV